MAKNRSMQQQLTYVVRNTMSIGQSKHADKGLGKKGVRHDGRSYSYATANGRLDVAKQFGKFMRDEYPEVKMAVQIKADHMNEFLQSKAGSCSNDTLRTYSSHLRALAKEIHTTYGKDLNIRKNDIKTPESTIAPVRTVTMTQEDIEKIHETYYENSNGDKAMVISRCTGARAEEIVTLRKEDVFTKDGTIYVHLNGKGGRERDVKVQEREMGKRLLEIAKNTPDNERIVPIKVGSIERSLERHMKSLGMKEQYKNTGFHSMRKAWSQRTYDRYRETHTKKESIEYVNEQLGHGAERDVALLGRYVENIS